MSEPMIIPFSRRTFLRASLAMPVPILLAACGVPATVAPTAGVQPTTEPAPSQPAPTQPAAGEPPTAVPVATQAQVLLPTPACGDDDDVTPAMTEGPFYTPDSPQRTSLIEPGIAGTPIVLTGYVLATDCRPVPGALVDFWHADDAGAYDNVGYKLRGHQFTDADGRYTLETIVPGLYPGRTRHFHVKVQAPNGPILTTQLFFPGEPDNDTDSIFNPALLMQIETAGAGESAAFDFVVQSA
jgi:protocatechuate 3,4-dioxygenase beta subunit